VVNRDRGAGRAGVAAALAPRVAAINPFVESGEPSIHPLFQPLLYAIDSFFEAKDVIADPLRHFTDPRAQPRETLFIHLLLLSLVIQPQI
jgi:hypothetical protein